MKGNWKGTYRYLSTRVPEELLRLEIPFNIRIEEFDGMRFSGRIEDDTTNGGMEGIGRITGRINDETIEFIKEMPRQSAYLPDGTRIVEDKPHRKIYYSGKIAGNSAEGIWKFKFGIGKVNNRWAIFPRSKGTWQMKMV